MGHLGLEEILLILGIVLIFSIAFKIVPFWFILRKAGFAPALSLLMALPLVHTILSFYLAFAEWPSLKKPVE